MGGITMQTIDTRYKGPCPVMIHFRANISRSPAHVKVRYHWERTDGKLTHEQSGEILDGGLDVGDEFAVGKPGHSFVATDRLHVSIQGDKRPLVGPRVESTGICTP